MSAGTARLLGPAMLALALLLPLPRGYRGLVALCAAQGCLLAAGLASAARGTMPPLAALGTALVVLAVQGIGLPYLALRAMRRRRLPLSARPPAMGGMLLGLALAAVALLLVPRLLEPPAIGAASALALLLLGGAFAASQGGGAQLAGHLTAWNGLGLAMLDTPALPVGLGLAVPLLALAAVPLFGMVLAADASGTLEDRR